MSKASTPTQPAKQASTPTTSAWSRGPPAAASNPSSNVPSTVSTPPPARNGASDESVSAGSNPVTIGGGKKGAPVGGGSNGPTGLAFGTFDSPNAMLSSSPAAPAATGSHLADAVKSFGSVDAESNPAGASTMVRPPRRPSNSAHAGPGAPQKKLDVHSLFAGRSHQPGGTPMSPSHSAQTAAGSPVQDRRQSLPQGGFPNQNGLPNAGPHPYQQMPGVPPTQPNLRPPHGGVPGQPRSPVMGGVQPQFTGSPSQQFRPVPQMPGQQAVRPNPNAPMGGVPRGPMIGQQVVYGVPQSGYMAYPQGAGYYPYYDQQQYGMPQAWAPPPHTAQMSMSPRQSQSQMGQPSPAPPNTQLPGSAGGSPMPTPPSRPQSLVGAHTSTPTAASPMPTTPQRTMQPGTPFTPQNAGTPGLSAGAASFTPRAKVKISRPDGSEINLSQAAAAAKGPSVPNSGSNTPETDEHPKKKVPSLPVIVRMESVEQKKTRLKEEEERRKLKEQDEKEEAERKERQERRAKEEAEKKAKDEAEQKAKDEAEQKAKDEAEQKAKDEAEQKAKDEAEQKAKDEAEQKAKDEAEKQAEAEKVAAAEDKAEDKVEDKPEDQPRKTILTPTGQSAAASPISSPALAAAGLPAKPVGAINGGIAAAARRSTPGSLDVKTGTAAAVPSGPSTPSALGTAKPIEDLASVEYPSSVQPQSAELNANSEPGKYRYDRDFLMQFMEVCKAKPDTLPALEEIGLEASDSSGFGGRSNSRRPALRSNTPMATRGIAPGGMAAFNYSPGLGGTSSTERYNRSLRSGPPGDRMVRMGSQGSPHSFHGLPPMAHSSSGRGRDRNSSKQGYKRSPRDAPAVNDPSVAPLQVTANAWVNHRSAGNDDKSPVYIERKIKALLNKLTEEKFDSISGQILEWANKSRDETDGMTLKLVIKQVFEKSTDEAHWSAMYAKLCRLLLDRLDPAVTEVIDGKTVSGGSLFRKYLLGRCQADFESGWKAREDAALAAAAKGQEDEERLAKSKQEGDGEVPMLSDEYYAAQKAKRRGLGLIQLIGELYKLEMLSRGVIRECLIRLLGNVENPDEEDLESTCKLLTTVGRQFEVTSPQALDGVFDRLNGLSHSDKISSRIRFMIMDVIDLRKNKWISGKESVPTTIAQIHQQAAREANEKAAAARESMSRGGSRAGRERREQPQPGEWQSVGATASRPPQRPTDFSNVGRGLSSGGSSGPTFGPTGAFAFGRKKGASSNTPPALSRHSSTNNMFGILDAAEEETPKARPKIQLKPRTKPIPGQEDEGEGEGEHSDAEGEGEGEAEEEETKDKEVSMTETEANEKIKRDLMELWGEKDQGGSRDPADIVEYFRALPLEHKPRLSEKLGEEVFRIAKMRDAEVVAKGWTAALAANVVSSEDLGKGIMARMETLDDDSIDFPQAYKAIGLLMRSVALSQEDIETYIAKVDVYGEPRVTPKMKLERAFVQIDEEAASA